MGNSAVRGIEKWGPAWRDAMRKQRALMDLLLDMDGTACFTFPSASIGVNGGYGCHRDKNDITDTVIISTGIGAWVFPQYEHVVHLLPGDVLVFDGCMW